MADKRQIEKMRDFLARHKEWLRRELPGCAAGIVSSQKDGDKPKIALRLRKITPKVAQKIKEFRQVAAAEGWELDVREVGVIRPRRKM